MMAKARYITPDGKVKTGELLVLQKMGTMPDGKLHFVAGDDADVFHLEDNDQFYTAIFAVDPFEGS